MTSALKFEESCCCALQMDTLGWSEDGEKLDHKVKKKQQQQQCEDTAIPKEHPESIFDGSGYGLT